MRIFIVLILATFYSSCSNNQIVWQEQYNPPGNIWEADSIYQFSFEVNDTSAFYNLYIETKNDNTYPYSNIWLFTHLVVNNQQQIFDTLEYDLCDYLGKWYGKKESDNYILWHVYRQGVRFGHKGHYILNIQQGMRKNKLDGIRSVGLVIQKQKQSK